MSHQERLYIKARISEDQAAPLFFFAGAGKTVRWTERRDHRSRPARLPRNGPDCGRVPNSLRGLFPGYPTKVHLESDRDEGRNAPATSRKPAGRATSRGEILVLASDDRGLIDTDIVLSTGFRDFLADTSWIKPGKVAWDWWNANNLYGVAFRAGVNTEPTSITSISPQPHGIEYVILDEGWYKLGDLKSVVVPEMNMDEL